MICHLICSVSALLNASAAQPPIADTQNTIIVQGSPLDPTPGLPAYGGIEIDQEKVENSASASVEDILRDVAGFSQFRRSDSRSANPSAQGANLRSLGGNATSRTLVLIDNVPISDPFFGYIPYNAISPERLSHIRITRGSGSGAFGAGAVSGTIEMFSATRDELPLVSGSAFYGSYDSSQVSAAISPNLGAGYITVSGRWNRSDGYHTTPADQRVPVTARAAYENWNISLRAVAPLNDVTEIQATGLLYRDDRTLRFTGADSHTEAQDASIRLVSRGNWQIDALAYVQARNFSNIVISSSRFRRALDQNDTPALGLGGKLELRPPVGENHALKFGADIRRASGDMFETAYISGLPSNPVRERRRASGNQTVAGFFIENDWTLGKLILTGAARLDHWTIRDGSFRTFSPTGTLTQDDQFPDRSGWEGTFRGGLLWSPRDGVALRAAAYSGFRIPTLNELYRGFVVFPTVTRANAQLKPERLKGAEVGADIAIMEGVSVGATLFANRLENAVSNVTIATNVRERQNIDAIMSKGIELNAQAQVRGFNASLSYAYYHSEVDAPGTTTDGLRPSQSARHSFSGNVGYASPEGYSANMTLRYAGKQFEDDLNQNVLPSAWTLDAMATMPIAKGVKLIARGENITDTTIFTRKAGTAIDLGKPRTLWVGLRFAMTPRR